MNNKNIALKLSGGLFFLATSMGENDSVYSFGANLVQLDKSDLIASYMKNIEESSSSGSVYKLKNLTEFNSGSEALHIFFTKCLRTG